MKQRTRLLSLCFVLLFCISVFAGCSSSSTEDDATDSDATDTATDTETETPVDTVSDTNTGDGTEQADDLIGEVTYVGESDITISIYESDTEIADYASLDGVTLTDTGNTDTVTLDSDAQYKYASSGLLYDTTLSDIELGDMIAVTVNDDGVQEIIILDYTTGDDSSDVLTTDDTSGIIDGTSDNSTTDDVSDTTDVTTTDGTDDTGADSTDDGTGTAAG